jgi:nucleolar protein 56
MATLLLYETTLGFGLYEYVPVKIDTLDDKILTERHHNVGSFIQILKLFCVYNFSTATTALKNIAFIGESKLTDELISFITTTPEVLNCRLFLLGIQEFRFGVAIKEQTGVTCICTGITNKLFRGIRSHLFHGLWLRRHIESELLSTQLHLGYIHSRTKIKQNSTRTDLMIIQAVELANATEKDIQSSSIRLRRWYGMYFPELAKIIDADYLKYAKVSLLLMDKSNVTSKVIPHLCLITLDNKEACDIVKWAKISIGKCVHRTEIYIIKQLAKRVVNIASFRKMIYQYLHDKMNNIAPNLSALVGTLVGAQLIHFGGSLQRLAKHPPSFLRILSVEKNLLQHIFSMQVNTKQCYLNKQSPLFTGKNYRQIRRRLSKYITNKCTMAARIDAFMRGFAGSSFGKKLKEQVEQRVIFYSHNNYRKIVSSSK